MRLRRELACMTEERDMVKKAAKYSVQGTAMKYDFMHAHSDEFSLTGMCRIFSVGEKWARVHFLRTNNCIWSPVPGGPASGLATLDGLQACHA